MKPAVTLSAFTPEWILDRRAVVVRDGYALRPGQLGCDRAGVPYTIEIKSLTTNEWLRLALPGGAENFENLAARDLVLAQLMEG